MALIGIGTGVGLALRAADLLESADVRPTVVDARFVKPLDTALIDELADTHARVVTIEENVLAGGFGSAVAEHLADSPCACAASGFPTRSSPTVIGSGCSPIWASPPSPSPPPSSNVRRGSRTSPEGMRERLDTLLVARGLFATRSQARAAVLAGEVAVGGRPRRKPGTLVDAASELAVAERPRYVSRGGDKLATRCDTLASRSRERRPATSAARPEASSTACCSTACAG